MILAGGLGNQLFQLSAGIFIAKSKSLELETGILTPQAKASTDLAELKLPPNVTIIDSSSRSALEKKIISFCIRESGNFNHATRITILELAASTALSLLRKKRVKVFINNGLGFDFRIDKINSNVMLIGYFQTHEWVSRVKTEVIDCFSGLKHKKIVKDTILQLPFEFDLVHIRLGDYLNEGGFGIPSESYFLDSLKIIETNKNNLKPSILFTDSPDIVGKYLPSFDFSRVSIFPRSDLSSVETIEVMRNASNFVISNSTFSWWAAYLSMSETKRVCAPSPWFRNIDPPKGLTPPEWFLVDSGLSD